MNQKIDDLLAQLKRTRHRGSAYTAYEKGGKKKRNAGARCRPRLQPRAAARENKKDNSNTTTVPLVVSRGGFSPNPAETRKPTSHKRVSFNNPVGRLNRRPDFSGSH